MEKWRLAETSVSDVIGRDDVILYFDSPVFVRLIPNSVSIDPITRGAQCHPLIAIPSMTAGVLHRVVPRSFSYRARSWPSLNSGVHFFIQIYILKAIERNDNDDNRFMTLSGILRNCI